LIVSRSNRLFELLQVLRRRRGTVSGETLAQETKVSLRTLRRDIATLQAMGVHIEGEAGVGYILRPGSLMPPMSFTEEEVQALAVGVQWVSHQADKALAMAAQNALAKIGAVVSTEMRRALDDDTYYVGSHRDTVGFDLARVRQAIREQRKMQVVYCDREGKTAGRVLWPFMIGIVESRRFISGWCELRQDFCLLRADGVRRADLLDERYPGNRRQLVKEWRSRLCQGRLAIRAAE
jgi:predicted DNA-binding transcriptional regulator YafY